MPARTATVNSGFSEFTSPSSLTTLATSAMAIRMCWQKCARSLVEGSAERLDRLDARLEQSAHLVVERRVLLADQVVDARAIVLAVAPEAPAGLKRRAMLA